jgi:hypothetical protein
VKGANARPGYDLASGLGEPNEAFPLELAALGDHYYSHRRVSHRR